MLPSWLRTRWAGTRRSIQVIKTDRLADWPRHASSVNSLTGWRPQASPVPVYLSDSWETHRDIWLELTERSQTAQNFISLFIIPSQDICHISRIFFTCEIFDRPFFPPFYSFFFLLSIFMILRAPPGSCVVSIFSLFLSGIFPLVFNNPQQHHHLSTLPYHSPFYIFHPWPPVKNCDKLNENENVDSCFSSVCAIWKIYFF